MLYSSIEQTQMINIPHKKAKKGKIKSTRLVPDMIEKLNLESDVIASDVIARL